jgi:ankyrin repeat protein
MQRRSKLAAPTPNTINLAWLSQALHADSVGCLKQLITHDRTFFKDNGGKTVAHMAAEKNCSAALRLIAQLRSDMINDLDKNGRTPLHWGAACGCTDALINARR